MEYHHVARVAANALLHQTCHRNHKLFDAKGAESSLLVLGDGSKLRVVAVALRQRKAIDTL